MLSPLWAYCEGTPRSKRKVEPDGHRVTGVGYLQNLHFQLRKNRSCATRRQVSRLLHGNYGDDDDAALIAALQDVKQSGVDPAVSFDLSYAEARLTVRTGALPARKQGALLEVCTPRAGALVCGA